VDRAWALVRERAAATDGHLVVVTHGLVCRSLAARHLLLADGEVVPERWENTAVTVVERAQGLRWPVRLLNCVAHLDDLAARSPLTLPSPLRGEGRDSGAV
jgi:broad specificity phosphatase PhoE